MDSRNCVFDKVSIDFKPIFQKKKQKKTRKFSSFSIIERSKSHLFKPAFTICKMAILLGM